MMLTNDERWRECILRRKAGQCRATVKPSPTDEFIRQVKDNTHARDKYKVSMKHKANTTEEKVQKIL